VDINHLNDIKVYLNSLFTPYGQIVHTKLNPIGKGKVKLMAIIYFRNTGVAQKAIDEMNGT